jgi:hypothetical protein
VAQGRLPTYVQVDNFRIADLRTEPKADVFGTSFLATSPVCTNHYLDTKLAKVGP